MSSFLSDFKRAFVQEARTTSDTPLLWLTGIVVPVFWCLAVVAVFATGLMRNIPVGLVDYDNSAESRDLIRSLDAVASVDFVNYENPQAATADLATGNIYALFVIGHSWSEKTSGSRSDSALELFLNKSYYAIATTVETDLKLALSQIQIGQMLEAASVVGGGFAGNKERLAVLDADILIAGNPALNFKAYLLTTILPGVLALGAILTCVGSLTREWRLKTVHQVVETYSHLTGFLLGRMSFWLVLYSLMGLAYLAWFTGWEGWGVQGNLAAWALGIVLFFASMPALAMLYTSLSPSWIIAMSVAIGTTAPIFPFTGFSFPLDSMDAAAQLLAQFLPLTWYLRLHSSQWVLGSELSHTIYLLSMLSLFVIIPAAVGLTLMPRRMRKWAQKEREAQPVIDLPEPVGFWETVRTVLARGAFTKDTFVIFVIAVAFYLLFYAWPYAAQNVTSIQTAVVDLDRSAASRAMIERIKSVAMINVVAIGTDRAEGESLYKTEKVAAVITIPENFEENLLAGKHTSVALTANGAFPVKSRAVMAGLMGVVGETTAASMALNLVRAGAPLETLKKLQTAPVAFTDVNLYNPLSGYASYIVAAVMPIIIQAVMFVSIVMSLGGWLASANPPSVLRAVCRNVHGFAALYVAFWLFSLMWLAYALGPDFVLFDFASMQNPGGTLLMAAIFGAAVVSFGLAFTFAMGTNAYGAQFFVVISAPALFLSGVVHPLFDMTPPALVLRLLLPSTSGINGLVAVSQNGAPLYAVTVQIAHLLLLTVAYGVLAFVLWKRTARKIHAEQSLNR
jgi:ribosome-dependent ATPase